MGMFGNIPREQIPWFPTIDFNNCVGCMECFNFCHNGVYDWDDQNNKPIIKNPYNCVIGCSACANLCNGGAIKFPTKKELMEAQKKIQER